MTYRENFTLPAELLERVSQQGFDILPELIRLVVNAAMQAERQQYLKAAPYQHTEERRGHANGYKPKTVHTRVGSITFSIPQVREGGFYPEALEKGLRSERALVLALAEMYVQGVSTRKVKVVTEKLCGVSMSSTQVSHAAALLDTELEKWRNRPLGEYVYLYLDAYYEQVREDGQVRDLAILTAVGVNRDGKREILGVSVSLSEHEVHWRAFLESLKARGLGGVQLIISDDHAGLRAARLAVFGGIPWQRCQFHLPAERTGLRAAQGNASRSSRRDPYHLQRSGPRYGRNLPGQDSGKVPEDCFPPGRVAGRQHPGRTDGLLLPRRSPAPSSYNQWRRTTSPGSPPQSACGEHLPQSVLLPPLGFRRAQRDQRGMAHRQNVHPL